MNCLDFISISPKTFIFQKTSNKTNLGGIFTSVYFIILALIIIAYLYDFFKYDHYEYSYFYKYLLSQDSKSKIKDDPDYDHPINLSFWIRDKNGSFLFNDFEMKIWNTKNIFDTKYEFGKTISLKVSDLDKFGMMINYVGVDSSKNKSSVIYDFYIRYSTKVLDNDNEDIPVVDEDFNSTISISFSPGIISQITAKWEVYEYEEKKGILSRVSDSILNNKNRYIFGRLSENPLKEVMDFSILNEAHFPYMPPIPIFDHGNLLFFYIKNDLEAIHQYKRKEISIWDYLANIAALGTTIFNGLTLAFSLVYSHNFDNYKIIDNILSKESKRTPKVELKTDNIGANQNIEENLIKKNIEHNKLYEDKDNEDDEDIIINQDDNIDIDSDDLVYTVRKTKLPKLGFYDFFFNNVYCKCCTYNKKQKLIDSCNHVLNEYYSIENILYNQIIFEHFLKDYQWNNPELKSIHKNESIINLKKYI